MVKMCEDLDEDDWDDGSGGQEFNGIRQIHQER